MIHHITVLARKADRLKTFYGDVLGLSLLEETVSQDDPETPQLVFGSPQGEMFLTFLLYPRSHRGVVGCGGVGSVDLAVRPGSLAEWSQRLRAWKLEQVEGGLSCVGPDGLRLTLVERDGVHGVVSLDSVTVHCSDEGQGFVEKHLGSNEFLKFQNSDFPAQLGYGSVHHVALCCRGPLRASPVPGLSPVKFRDGYESRYFHDPDGALWELVGKGRRDD